MPKVLSAGVGGMRERAEFRVIIGIIDNATEQDTDFRRRLAQKVSQSQIPPVLCSARPLLFSAKSSRWRARIK